MKLELFNEEANNIWKRANSNKSSDQLQFELDLHKKLLSFFQVGNYYYLVLNLTTFELELASKEIKTVLGYDPSEFNIRYLMDMTHPDDRPYFLNFEHKAAEFFTNLPVEKILKYKIRYDYRIRKKDGEYIRILHQSAVIEHDENGGIIRTLSVHTDITHLKPEGKPTFSIIGLDGEPSYINIDVKKIFTVSKELLSKREKEILLLIMDGKLSKEISEILHISKQTIDTHRNNMITKNNVRNSSELITKAIKQGWI